MILMQKTREQLDTLSRAMRIFRANYPQDLNLEPKAGYFYVPISVDNRPYDLPLGFLGTTGCAWAKQGGCTMCNYGGFASRPSDENLIQQSGYLLQCWEKEGPLKEINLSAIGSFFDEGELSSRAREAVLRNIASRNSVDLVGVESRAEFINAEKIKEARQILGSKVRFDVGMGLESSNEFIRNMCINKGLSEGDYLKAVNCIKSLGACVTTHILFKPPFLNESEAIEDAITSINYAENTGADTIVLMVSNVKDYTLTDWMAKRGLYNTPWLWSVLKAALEINERSQRKLLIYGFKCGITLNDTGKNCPSCTSLILKYIEQFNFTNNVKYLEDAFAHGCSCKHTWGNDINGAQKLNIEALSQKVEMICKIINEDVLKHEE